jgi:hypothetical protein
MPVIPASAMKLHTNEMMANKRAAVEAAALGVDAKS